MKFKVSFSQYTFTTMSTTTQPQAGMTWGGKTNTTSAGSSTVEPMFDDNDKYAGLASLAVGVYMYSQGYDHYILGSIGASIAVKAGLSYYDSLNSKVTAQAHASIQTQHT